MTPITDEELTALAAAPRDITERTLARDTLDRLIAGCRERNQRERMAPLCKEHGKGSGVRSSCPWCAYSKLTAALSQIDYACGEPNEMEIGLYDVDYHEGRVVEAVKAMRADRDRLAAELAALQKAAQPIANYVRKVDSLTFGYSLTPDEYLPNVHAPWTPRMEQWRTLARLIPAEPEDADRA